MNPDEIINENITLDSSDTTDMIPDTNIDPLDDIADIEEARKQAKAYRAMAQRYKKNVNDKPKEKPPEPKRNIEDSFIKDVAELKLSEKKRQFGYTNSLSPEETDRLFRFAGDRPPEEALKDEFFQGGLKEFRKNKKVEDAIPSSSGRGQKIEGKTFTEMTPEDRAKNWTKITGVN
jgi:hypothetical protein